MLDEANPVSSLPPVQANFDAVTTTGVRLVQKAPARLHVEASQLDDRVPALVPFLVVGALTGSFDNDRNVVAKAWADDVLVE